MVLACSALMDLVPYSPLGDPQARMVELGVGLVLGFLTLTDAYIIIIIIIIIIILIIIIITVCVSFTTPPTPGGPPVQHNKPPPPRRLLTEPCLFEQLPPRHSH